jgi:hypothetical protein
MKPNPQLDQFWREYPEYHGLPKEYAGFGVSFVPLEANQIDARAAFRAPPDADLVLTSVFGEFLLPGSVGYQPGAPPVLMSYLTPEARNVNNIPLASFCMAGNGNAQGPLPSIPWPWPIVLKANTQFTVLMANRTATVCNVFLTFHAVRVLLPAGLVQHG